MQSPRYGPNIAKQVNSSLRKCLPQSKCNISEQFLHCFLDFFLKCRHCSINAELSLNFCLKRFRSCDKFNPVPGYPRSRLKPKTIRLERNILETGGELQHRQSNTLGRQGGQLSKQTLLRRLWPCRPYVWPKQQVSMIRKYNNHTPQTNSLHRDEVPITLTVTIHQEDS